MPSLNYYMCLECWLFQLTPESKRVFLFIFNCPVIIYTPFPGYKVIRDTEVRRSVIIDELTNTWHRIGALS